MIRTVLIQRINCRLLYLFEIFQPLQIPKQNVILVHTVSKVFKKSQHLQTPTNHPAHHPHHHHCLLCLGEDNQCWCNRDSHYRLLLLLMRVVVLFHSPTRTSKSFVQMHRWRLDPLHHETSRRCNSRQNHGGSSEIAPRYLPREDLFLQLLHKEMVRSRPRLTQCFFAAATNFLAWCRKDISLSTLGNLYIHSFLSMNAILHKCIERNQSHLVREKGLFCELWTVLNYGIFLLKK